MDEISIMNQLTLKTIKKGEYFLMAGSKLKEAGLINKGLFRFFYIDPNGNEHTKHFAAEGDFLISFNAFYKDAPGDFFIKAEENCEVMCISVEKLRKLLKENEEWRTIYYKNLESSYSLKEKRTADFLMKNSTERYLDFVENYPNIINRIKQIHLASYLGIKPESLSRIRKKILT